MIVQKFNGQTSHTWSLNEDEQKHWKDILEHFFAMYQKNSHFVEYRNFYILNHSEDVCETMVFCKFADIIPAISAICSVSKADVDFIADLNPLHTIAVGLTDTKLYSGYICEYIDGKIIIRDKVTDRKKFMI